VDVLHVASLDIYKIQLFYFCEKHDIDDDLIDEKIAEKYQCEELEAGYFPDIPVFDQAETSALKKSNGYPDKWPWLKKNIFDVNVQFISLYIFYCDNFI
jgi:hypothetical protein